MEKAEEKDARAPDDVEENNDEARQGEVRRGKTRDAFAFRDFDGTRILQLKYLRKNTAKVKKEICFTRLELNIKGRDDDDIINSLNPEDIDDLELAIDFLSAIISGADKYISHLKNHCLRLERYLNIVARRTFQGSSTLALSRYEVYAPKIQRGEENVHRYNLIIEHFNSLVKLVNARRADLELDKKNLYRKGFAERLRYAREAKKWTQAFIAQRLNMNQSSYSLYETGKREPSIAVLCRLSKILGESADHLLCLDGGDPF